MSVEGLSVVIFYWTSVAAFISFTIVLMVLSLHQASLFSAVEYSTEQLNQQLNNVLYHLGVIISNQEHLDSDVAALVAAASAITDEIAALKAQPAAEALDFSGLDGVVSTLQGLVPAAPAVAADEAAPVEPVVEG